MLVLASIRYDKGIYTGLYHFHRYTGYDLHNYTLQTP